MMRSLSIGSLVFISGWVSIPLAVAGAMRGIWLVTGAILVERVFILVAGLLVILVLRKRDTFLFSFDFKIIRVNNLF